MSNVTQMEFQAISQPCVKYKTVTVQLSNNIATNIYNFYDTVTLFQL